MLEVEVGAVQLLEEQAELVVVVLARETLLELLVLPIQVAVAVVLVMPLGQVQVARVLLLLDI